MNYKAKPAPAASGTAQILAFTSPALPEHQLQSLVARNMRQKRPRPLDAVDTLMLVEHVVSRLVRALDTDTTMALLLETALGYLTIARKVSEISKPEPEATA